MILGAIDIVAEDGVVVANFDGKTVEVSKYTDLADDVATLYAWQGMIAGNFPLEMKNAIADLTPKRVTESVEIEEIEDKGITAVIDGVKVTTQDIKANVAPVTGKIETRKPGNKIGLGKKK
jgi:hypothetical protein